RVAGGATPIDAETAHPLVARNLEALPDGHVQLRTDARLLRPSLVRFSPEQMGAMLTAIRCPVLLVEGETGIMRERTWARQARAAVTTLTRCVLSGGHHLHLEPASVDEVAKAIVWWQES
ncbi:MAG: alpha/beta hydrolase, partial [Halomonas sp.]|uniref:alpha/beta fold hydrolase n=1 Tax=Halomonas sp. TaxID=1486246 RepID=UPI0028713D9A|nr:alpha/beta hydrolase [Halomonas sp.]